MIIIILANTLLLLRLNFRRVVYAKFPTPVVINSDDNDTAHAKQPNDYRIHMNGERKVVLNLNG